MSYKIEQRRIPGLKQKALTASCFVVAHESGNPNNVGSNSLENEIKYMMNNWNKGAQAFTSHWVGSGGRIVQLCDAGKFQHGAGGKANPYSYAHVELARTNNKATFEKDYKAYIWLLRHLADEAGLPKTFDTGSSTRDKGIKSHDWIRRNLGGTTHTDPFGYLASWGITRAQFKHDVENGLGGAPAQPAKPSTSREAKFIKNENAFFLVTTPDGIKVRNKPSVSATHTGTLEKGNSINYHKVYEGGGYRWLQYVGNSGNTLYVPYRESGSGKEQWGTFHSERPGSKPAKKSNAAIAKEVLDGKWGNNPQRKQKLEKAGYNYSAIQAEVNRLAGAKPKKTIDQMAREVVKGIHGQGHAARQRSLGISNAEYQQVRARVNQLA